MNAPTYTQAEADKLMDECFAVAAADRDKLASFYDVRLVLCAYLTISAQLAAAMRKHGIYDAPEVTEQFADALRAALTHESKAPCIRKIGDDAIEGGKQ